MKGGMRFALRNACGMKICSVSYGQIQVQQLAAYLW